MGSPQSLGEDALVLAAEACTKLARWLPLFESRLAEAESAGAVPDLKDMTQFLTALKRTLEIARIAGILAPGDAAHDDTRNPLDPETLRQLFPEDD
ncbi:hypothetical protein GC173_13820 [bacterium]|nr:hypothetical protein [bacterium]